MKELFDHADDKAWSITRLENRLRDVQETQKVPHTPERLKQIDHELACLAFELVSREQEAIKRQEEIAWLEKEIIEDCPTEPIDTEAINKLLAEGGDGSEDTDMGH